MSTEDRCAGAKATNRGVECLMPRPPHSQVYAQAAATMDRYRDSCDSKRHAWVEEMSNYIKGKPINTWMVVEPVFNRLRPVSTLATQEQAEAERDRRNERSSNTRYCACI